MPLTWKSYDGFSSRQLLCVEVILTVLWKQLDEKWESQICLRCWSNVVKYRKKLLQTAILLIKWIQLKVYSHPVRNVWISFLTLMLIFWWIELVILGSHRKVYKNPEFLGEKKNFCIRFLNVFFHTGKPVSSWVLVW